MKVIYNVIRININIYSLHGWVLNVLLNVSIYIKNEIHFQKKNGNYTNYNNIADKTTYSNVILVLLPII